MKKTIFFYAAALGVAALVLQWVQFQYVTRVFATEFYIVLIAAGFTALGIWAGRRLTGKSQPGSFERNDAAIASLGISPREYETLALLAAGHTNKEIARKLAVSPNTVKTHLAKVYEKLEVSRRTQAVQKAKELALIP